MPDDNRPPQEPEGSSDRRELVTFMNKVIHELNNDISVVTINAGMLEGMDDALTKELAAEIADAAARAAAMTAQLRRCLGEIVASIPSADHNPQRRRPQHGAAE